jgi:hypothetical protein
MNSPVLFVGEFSIERAKQYGEKDVEDIVKKGFFYLSERSTTDNLNRKALESGLNKHFSVSPFD